MIGKRVAPDERLTKGWGMFVDDEGEELYFTLDDWAEEPELVPPEVGLVFLSPADFLVAFMRSLHRRQGDTLH